MRACIFCDGRPTNLEHVLPEWLARKMAFARSNVVERFAKPAREWTVAGSFGMTVKAVCGKCNSGWMSALEHQVRPFVGPMALGQRVAINTVEQQALGAWMWKTMLVLDARSRTSRFGDGERKRFYDTRTPPEGRSRMWFGGFVSATGKSQMVLITHSLKLEGVALGHAVVLTLQIGAALFQAMTLRTGRSVGMDAMPTSGLHLDAGVIQFWPTNSTPLIAPSAAVPERHFATFANRWKNRVAYLRW